MRSLEIALAGGLLLAASCQRGERAGPARETVSTADSILLTTLADSLEALPSRYQAEADAGRAPDRYKMTEDAWRTTQQRIAAVAARAPESAEREWLIGEVLVSAFHVEVQDSAFQMAEQHLRRAMELDSTYAAPRLALARLYVNSDPSLAPAAERLLRGARVRPGAPEALQVHEGLAFALYYQGRLGEAGEEARLALAAGSRNGAMQMIAARAPRQPASPASPDVR
jgi:hypothetical protein